MQFYLLVLEKDLIMLFSKFLSYLVLQIHVYDTFVLFVTSFTEWWPHCACELLYEAVSPETIRLHPASAGTCLHQDQATEEEG